VEELIEFKTSGLVHMKACLVAACRTDTTTAQTTSHLRAWQLAPQAALLTDGIGLDDTRPIDILHSSCWQQRESNRITVFPQATVTRDTGLTSDSR